MVGLCGSSATRAQHASYQHTRLTVIGTIGKMHGHYQMERNTAIVKKKTYGKKNSKQG
jgi:uncharacterized protein affecting Mg2+/Co2+ transport